MKKKLLTWLIIVAAVLAGFFIYSKVANRKNYDETKFACGNGRLEATEVNVSAKLAGRIDKIFVKEGELVKIGTKLVQMNTDVLSAQLEQAKATLLQKQAAKQKEEAELQAIICDVSAAEALLAQEKSRFDGAEKQYKRYRDLIAKKATSQQQFDTVETSYQSAKSTVANAEANLQKARAAIATAKAKIQVEAAAMAAAKADIRRIQADIDDSLLISKHEGRIEYRLAEEGEVIAAGGGVLNQTNLTDVYMSVFLPEKTAGLLEIGTEARIVLDVMPQYPIPAQVSYVASVAQFTPKSVETKSEREKLMFRVKIKINAKLLLEYIQYVKTGMPGVAYIRLDPKAEWPEFLHTYKERTQQSKEQ